MNTDERLTALIEALDEVMLGIRGDFDTRTAFRTRLAALRAPGVEPDDGGTDWKATAEFRQAQLDECRPERDAWQRRADEAEAALATARRERDEAFAILRDLDTWAATTKPEIPAIVDRARALVAGQATPDARDAEIAGWREASKAMTGEIATLRAQLDTALARVAELEAREVAANHRALGLQYELDTGVAALQERDRESRWIIEHIPMMQGSPTFEARVAEYLSATPPADPARGLIERLVAAYDGCSRRGTIEECNAQERAVYDAIRDLRARIAELEARDREGRWIVQESRNACDTEPCAYGKQHRHDDYDCRRTAYLSGAAPPDPARGLIERAVGWIHTRFHETGVSEPASRLLQDLRAYLGGGT